MKREVGIRMELTVQKAAGDPYYQKLLSRYRALDAQLQETLITMTREQRSTVEDYCWVTGALYRAVLETACEELVSRQEGII